VPFGPGFYGLGIKLEKHLWDPGPAKVKMGVSEMPRNLRQATCKDVRRHLVDSG